MYWEKADGFFNFEEFYKTIADSIQAGCSGKATMLYSAPDHLIAHFGKVCEP